MGLMQMRTDGLRGIRCRSTEQVCPLWYCCQVGDDFGLDSIRYHSRKKLVGRVQQGNGSCAAVPYATLALARRPGGSWREEGGDYQVWDKLPQSSWSE